MAKMPNHVTVTLTAKVGFESVPPVVALFPCDVCHELADFLPDQIVDLDEELVCGKCQEASDAPV